MLERLRAEARKDRGNSLAWMKLAHHLYYYGDTVEAKDCLRRAIKLNRKDPFPIILLGNVLLSQHGKETTVEKLLENSPFLEDNREIQDLLFTAVERINNESLME
jgi:cytochrome c-type biogenesis protein CcmH/NrfG